MQLARAPCNSHRHPRLNGAHVRVLRLCAYLHSLSFFVTVFFACAYCACLLRASCVFRRQAQQIAYNYMLVVGPNDAEAGTTGLRERGSDTDTRGHKVDDVLALLLEKIAKKTLPSDVSGEGAAAHAAAPASGSAAALAAALAAAPASDGAATDTVCADSANTGGGGGGAKDDGVAVGKKKGHAAHAQVQQPEFTKVEVKVGLIEKVWAHPDSSKLWMELVNVGDKFPKQIASGLRAHYTAEQMLHRRILVVNNLKAVTLGAFVHIGLATGGGPYNMDPPI